MHVHLARESLDLGDEEKSGVHEEHPYAVGQKVPEVGGNLPTDFNLKTSAEVLMIQRKDISRFPWHKNFWPEDDVTVATLPKEDALICPESTCLRPSCQKPLREYETRIVWVLGVTKAFKSKFCWMVFSWP